MSSHEVIPSGSLPRHPRWPSGLTSQAPDGSPPWVAVPPPPLRGGHAPPRPAARPRRCPRRPLPTGRGARRTTESTVRPPTDTRHRGPGRRAAGDARYSKAASAGKGAAAVGDAKLGHRIPHPALHRSALHQPEQRPPPQPGEHARSENADRCGRGGLQHVLGQRAALGLIAVQQTVIG